jgi:hypothetical protein
LNDWGLGLAAVYARPGSTTHRNLHNPDPARQAETVIERSDQHPVTSSFQAQPYLQNVVHSGWDRTLRNVLDHGLRVSLVSPRNECGPGTPISPCNCSPDRNALTFAAGAQKDVRNAAISLSVD